MPRSPVQENRRLAIRIRSEDKALLLRAAALSGCDMTEFISRTVLQEAQAVIDRHERLKLSERDSKRVLTLLENPPPASARLRKAAKALPKEL